LVTASDGGGSIRIPASFTGCFGLKPSFGRVPRGPMSHWDYGATSVYGPLTKTVADAALFLDVVVGADGADPRSLPHPGYRYVDRLRDAPPAALRVALSLDLGCGAVQADVARVVEEAALALAARVGATVTRVAGGPPEMGAEWGLLNAYELGAELGERLEGREGEVSRSLMDGLRMARGLTQAWWGQTARRRAEVVTWCAALFEDHDVLITPTTPFTAPPAKGPFPREIDGNPLPLSSAGTFTIPFNLSWHPAASVRAGLSDAGLPIGMQIVVPHHRDDLALMLSLAFERERPGHPHWPLR
jgi:aspartyl-tRNA(Asn)/glutamyl-tRNA(Gln) amidotransferase subunit A